MKPCMQGVKDITLKIFQIVPCIVPNISWKFRENASKRFHVMLLTDRQTYKPTEMKT